MWKGVRHIILGKFVKYLLKSFEHDSSVTIFTYMCYLSEQVYHLLDLSVMQMVLQCFDLVGDGCKVCAVL